ncbi:Septin-11, partial [Ophiophagus hannah]
HVGFDSLPDQLVNKSTSQGFCFNILCVGETGIGKSTLMDTLFNTKFESDAATHKEPGVRLKARSYELQESNVRLKLTIVDTVGFGDQINKDDSYKPIVEYIDAQFEAYLQEELKIKRSLFNYHDTRIHACLYFIAPTGHSLKSLDLVNIIPIIAKADTIAKNELHKFKSKIMSELVSNGVQIYQFPTDEETVAEINATMSVSLSFLSSSQRTLGTEEVKIGNKMAKARQYPWGVVQVENENHCDFVKLREMLIRVNMEDLREQTHSRHYELYRRCKLEEMGFKDTDPDSKPFRWVSKLTQKEYEYLLGKEKGKEGRREKDRKNMGRKEKDRKNMGRKEIERKNMGRKEIERKNMGRKEKDRKNMGRKEKDRKNMGRKERQEEYRKEGNRKEEYVKEGRKKTGRIWEGRKKTGRIWEGRREKGRKNMGRKEGNRKSGRI